ncbi:sugar kinase [Metabacillus sp. Hm71]|uniref:sugar kinase n=1 Tax=Metabacillus sp. Hm71 TaxID=3450743 RepID=UPI003F42F9F1
MAEIITIGEILVEVMAKEIGQKFDETGEFIGPFPSGAPAIFIDQAAKCGSDSMIISAVGKDGFGEINLLRLQRSGVNISRIKQLKNETTGVAFVTYQNNGDRDFLYHISNAACGFINEGYIEEIDFKNCTYFHIMGSSIYNDDVYRAILKGIEFAKKYGSKLSFDPNVRKEIVTDIQKRNRLVEILLLSDIILAGENELFYLTDIKDEVESVNYLLNKGAEIIIIKRGNRGATLYSTDLTMNVDAYKVEEIDPTGAGDCFGGTFLSCLNQGFDIRDAFELASIAGAQAVTKKGPMEGNTTLQELNLINKQILNQ